MTPNILVPLDGSALAEQALRTAVALATQHTGRLELAIVHEQQPFDGFQDAPWNSMTASMQARYVADKAAQLRAECPAPVGHALLRGNVAKEIVRHARITHADVIVMATHGRTGISRALVGSVADSVIRDAGVPVLIVRDAQRPAAPPLVFETILILDDGSWSARQIIDSAVGMATPGVTRFLVLQVVGAVQAIPDPSLPFGYLPASIDTTTTGALVAEVRASLGGLAADVAARSGCTAEAHVVVGEHPSAAIVEFAEQHNVDLIAMATHGRGASRLLIGSVTDGVLRATTLPMLVLRPLAR